MLKLNQRGFTLPELLVVMALFAGMLAVTVAFLRPTSYANQEEDAQRRLGISLIAQALKEYKADNGSWPPTISTKEMAISTQEGSVDLCQDLVPVFLKDLPLDPQLGIQYTGEDADPQLTTDVCTGTGIKYQTGYAVKKSADNKTVTVLAGSTAGTSLEVTVQ